MSENTITQSDFDSFVSRFSDYLAKANESKKRGNNDYNPLLVIRSAKDEAKLHTRILHSFLDTDGAHYQDDLFLRFFLESLQLKGCEYKNLLEWFDDTANACVEKGYYITNECDKGFIDLYIYNDTKHIILENKVDSGDGDKQIAKYIDNLRENGYENIAVVYLTKMGDKLSDKSRDKWKIKGNFLECENDKVLYISISYADEILEKWIGKCQSKSGVGNIANLNYALECYKDIVKIITDKKENAMSIADFFKDSEDFENDFKLAFEIIKNAVKIKEAYLQKLQTELDKLSITDWKILVGKDECEIFFSLPDKQWWKNVVVYNKRYEESEQTFRFMFENEKDKSFGVRLSIRKDNGGCINFVDKDKNEVFVNKIAKNIREMILKNSNLANIKFCDDDWWLEGRFNLYDCKNNPLKYFKENYEKVIKVNEWLKEQEFDSLNSEIAKLAKEVKDYQIDS